MVRLNEIIDQVLAYHSKADIALIQKAYVYSARVHQGQVRQSGEPYLAHPLEVADILAKMKLDVVSIVAGLLHDTIEDTRAASEEIFRMFGQEVGSIVEGVTKISRLEFQRREAEQAETMRKMILAMANDIRVLLVKIADRLHNMRTLGYLEEERQYRIARETLDIYAPLAGRLGLGAKKFELEDLALFYLEPSKYREIRTGIAQKKEERTKYSEEVQHLVEEMLRKNKIQGRIKGRLKHIYSVYRKMIEQNLNLNQVYDLTAFRIVVGSVRSCYETLGLIHQLWTPIPGRIKDYIAMPKSNMYQSLHTTVLGPHAERVEFQIRTEDMDRVAEEGIAAHWRYKEGSSMPEAEGKRFAWLRRLLDWQRDLEDPLEFLESLRVDLYPDEVYVFTPTGDVKAFAKGATPIDFAYAIHTQVGHTCTGARVNGRLVSLKEELQNGDMIEIITNPHSAPGKDWLSIAKTSKARAKIRQWIAQEERKRSLLLGREMMEKEIRRHRLSFSKIVKAEVLEGVAKEFSFKSVDDLLAGVGYGRISPKQVVRKLLPKPPFEGQEELPSTTDKILGKLKPVRRTGVSIKGVHDVLINLARCCNPLPGDGIVGYITRGRGVTVHVYDCPILRSVDSERLLEVSWERGDDGRHEAHIHITSADSIGILAALSNVLTRADANIVKANAARTDDQKAFFDFTIEVTSKKHLDKVMTSLKKIKEVIKVERLRA
jgi:GTP diphosphokinase / guanosine-3',5'-bis(diphosphate) 3'-diphosphatase